MRRYLEGRRQLVEDEKHAKNQQRSQTSTSSNAAQRKQRLKSGQQAERNRLLNEINGEFGDE